MFRGQAPEVEHAAMTIAEQLRNEGREEGLRAGRASVLTKLLRLRFGALTPEHEAAIASATPEQLDGWVERVLTAETVAAVLAP